jgi:hypothetical protein
MGFSSSKTKTTQNVNQNETGTTMPVTPDWLTGAAQDYVGRIGAFGDMDPNSFVAGAAPLQQQAWGNADRLDDWQPLAQGAAGMAAGAGMAKPNLAGAPAGTGGGFQGQAPQPGGKFSADGAYAPDRGSPFPTPAGGYSPAPQMPGYAMPRTGQPIGGGNPALTGASQAAAYSNPYDQQVIGSTLNSFDMDAGQRRAQLEAAGARNRAFGGSRFGLAEGQFDADTAMNRGALEGGLRQQGFNTANQLGMQDASAGNTMNMFNAGQQDNALNRQLSAAGLMGGLADSYGSNTRADLGTMSTLGDQQRQIEQGYAMAPLAQLEAMGQLSGMTPYDILVGRNVTGNTTGTTTSTTTGRPSLFSQLLQMGQAGANAYASGMGG